MIVLTLLAFILLSILVILVTQFVTGYTPRAYETLPASASVSIAGREVPISEVAARYVPQMHQDPTEPTPPLLEVEYEITAQDDEYIINYYFVWEDEVHPNPFIHAMYWVYRAARYGYPVRDIEYVQVNVSAKDGAIDKVRFETSPGQDYYVTNSIHLISQYYPTNNGTFEATVTNLDGTPNATRAWPLLRTPDSHAQLAIATWNHLTRALGDDAQRYSTRLEAPLRYLTDAEYAEAKYSRKSHGDLGTPESPGEAFAANLATNAYFVLSGIALVALLIRIGRRK